MTELPTATEAESMTIEDRIRVLVQTGYDIRIRANVFFPNRFVVSVVPWDLSSDDQELGEDEDMGDAILMAWPRAVS